MVSTKSSLVDYRIARAQAEPVRAALYEYVMAARGLFVRAKKPGLEVCFSIARAEVRGLPELHESFEWQAPRVPADMVERILIRSQIEAERGLEVLFHLSATGGRWELEVPEQEQSAVACKPLESGPDSSHARALIEIHSHHEMEARFSSTDDRDEQGFRLYGVIGRVMSEPEIRLRVGVYGYFWEVPATWVMGLPQGLKDCNKREGF